MPRRDGFPTNQEMMVDFNSAAHELFMTAYEIDFGDGLDPAFEGKPLRNLYFDIEKIHAPLADLPSNFVKVENLEISPITENDALKLHTHLTMRNLSEAVLSRYLTLAENIGSVVLSDEVDLQPVLPAEAIVANYCAHFDPGQIVRNIHTFKEKPSKQSIAAGKFFLDECLEYVKSEDYKKPPIAQLLQLARTEARGSSKDLFTANFQLKMTADLPLNGYEPTAFLEDYMSSMLERAQNRIDNLEKMQALNAPESIIERQKELIDEVASAAIRAQLILDRR